MHEKNHEKAHQNRKQLPSSLFLHHYRFYREKPYERPF
jgi:hypothetical protein